MDSVTKHMIETCGRRQVEWYHGIYDFQKPRHSDSDFQHYVLFFDEVMRKPAYILPSLPLIALHQRYQPRPTGLILIVQNRRRVLILVEEVSGLKSQMSVRERRSGRVLAQNGADLLVRFDRLRAAGLGYLKHGFFSFFVSM